MRWPRRDRTTFVRTYSTYICRQLLPMAALLSSCSSTAAAGDAATRTRGTTSCPSTTQTSSFSSSCGWATYTGESPSCDPTRLQRVIGYCFQIMPLTLGFCSTSSPLVVSTTSLTLLVSSASLKLVVSSASLTLLVSITPLTVLLADQ